MQQSLNNAQEEGGRGGQACQAVYSHHPLGGVCFKGSSSTKREHLQYKERTKSEVTAWNHCTPPPPILSPPPLATSTQFHVTDTFHSHASPGAGASGTAHTWWRRWHRTRVLSLSSEFPKVPTLLLGRAEGNKTVANVYSIVFPEQRMPPAWFPVRTLECSLTLPTEFP